MIPATLPAPAPATDTKTVETGGEADGEATFAHVLGQMFVLGSAGEETPDTGEGPDGSVDSPDETIAGAGVRAGGEQQVGEDAPTAADGLADPGTTELSSSVVVGLDAETESDMRQGPGDANRLPSDRVGDRHGLAVAQANAAEPARLATAPPGPASDRSGQQTRAHGSKPLEGSTPPRPFPQATGAPSQSPAEARPRPAADLATTPAPAGSPTSAEPARVDVEADVDVDVDVDREIDVDVTSAPATELGDEADAAAPRTMADTEDGDADQQPNRRGQGNEVTRTDTPSAATHRAEAVATTDTRVAPGQAVPTAPGMASPSVVRADAATVTAPAADVAAPADAPMPVNAPAPPATVAVTSAAVATPAQAPTPTPVPAQLVDHVTPLLNKGDGIHEVTIELDPVDLGRVRLEVTLDDGVVSVRVHADDPATRRLLASSIHELRASLTEAGVSAGDLDVRDGDIGGRERPETGERRRHGSAHDDGRSTPGDRPRPRTSSRSALDVLL